MNLGVYVAGNFRRKTVFRGNTCLFSVDSSVSSVVSSERAAWSAVNSEEKSVRAGVFMLLRSRSIEQRAQGAGAACLSRGQR